MGTRPDPASLPESADPPALPLDQLDPVAAHPSTLAFAARLVADHPGWVDPVEQDLGRGRDALAEAVASRVVRETLRRYIDLLNATPPGQLAARLPGLEAEGLHYLVRQDRQDGQRPVRVDLERFRAEVTPRVEASLAARVRGWLTPRLVRELAAVLVTNAVAVALTQALPERLRPPDAPARGEPPLRTEEAPAVRKTFERLISDPDTGIYTRVEAESSRLPEVLAEPLRQALRLDDQHDLFALEEALGLRRAA